MPKLDVKAAKRNLQAMGMPEAVKFKHTAAAKRETERAMQDRHYAVPVPCGDCHICCTEQVVLMPGIDDPADYDCGYNSKTGVLMLRQKPNGDCIYLEDGKCSIHGRQPYVCRGFDCRRLHQSIMALRLHARKEWMRKSPDSVPMMEQGKRLSESHPLTD